MSGRGDYYYMIIDYNFLALGEVANVPSLASFNELLLATTLLSEK